MTSKVEYLSPLSLNKKEITESFFCDLVCELLNTQNDRNKNFIVHEYDDLKIMKKIIAKTEKKN